jgi:hypothetical protein
VVGMSIFEWVAACLVGVLSVARTARLLVWDEYPPTMWLRMKWDARTEGSTWNKLLHCQFCMTPYLTAGMMVWAWLAGAPEHLHWTWWVVNGWWAASYLAASYVAYDQPD